MRIFCSSVVCGLLPKWPDIASSESIIHFEFQLPESHLTINQCLETIVTIWRVQKSRQSTSLSSFGFCVSCVLVLTGGKGQCIGRTRRNWTSRQAILKQISSILCQNRWMRCRLGGKTRRWQDRCFKGDSKMISMIMKQEEKPWKTSRITSQFSTYMRAYHC